MNLNGWTPIPHNRAAPDSARINRDYTLRISGRAAQTLDAAGYAEAYTNADRQIALRPADTNANNARRVIHTSNASVKVSLIHLRTLGYQAGQQFTVAQQGDLFVLTPRSAQ